jgi:hypothetical protein
VLLLQPRAHVGQKCRALSEFACHRLASLKTATLVLAAAPTGAGPPTAQRLVGSY